MKIFILYKANKASDNLYIFRAKVKIGGVKTVLELYTKLI